eukprot:TRINITY_DN6052_c0_g2_i1.p1 TRINITY_DN6052_c0_g2~~TRINITY_DN6052_c0_g2_i1.p1  ORF type:complete len:553 (-),score=240.06 TRINITY_DN6052_c0_g2_i1:14-1672(-)
MPGYWKSPPSAIVSDEGVMSKIGESELEVLYPAAAPKAEQPKEAAAPTDPKKLPPVSLLDPRRSNNVSIVLSQFKMSTDDIKKATINADEAVLSLENVEALLKYLPTTDEIETVRSYTGDISRLGKAEKFYLDISDVPRMEDKLKGLEFKMKFGGNVQKVKEDLEILVKCVETVRGSPKLAQIMQIVLAIGNYLNSGTPRGLAYGFKLETLVKLGDTKSTLSSRSNLNHFITKFVEANFPELLELPLELEPVQKAMKVDVNQAQSTINELNQGITSLNKEIEASEKDEGDFHKKMKQFSESAKDEIQNLVGEGKKLEKTITDFIEFMGESGNEFIDVLKVLDNFSKQFEGAKQDNIKAKILAEKEAKKKALAEAKAKASGNQGATGNVLAAATVDDKKKGGHVVVAEGEGVIDALFGSIKSGNFKLRRSHVNLIEEGKRSRRGSAISKGPMSASALLSEAAKDVHHDEKNATLTVPDVKEEKEEKKEEKKDEKKPEEPLPDLNSFTGEDVSALTKLQARFRAKKAGGNPLLAKLAEAKAKEQEQQAAAAKEQ